jgi:hypothetical protein
MSGSLRANMRAPGRLLTIAATALMGYGAFWPVMGEPIARGGQILASIAITTTLASVLVPLGNRLAFTLLWASFGMACALGIIGLFSVGFVYWAAALLLLAAIFATPNRSDLELRYDWRYIAAFYVGFLTTFLAVLL